MIPFEQLCNLTRSRDGGSNRDAIEVRWIDLSGCGRWLELRVTFAPFRGSDMMIIHASDVSERRYIQQKESQAEKTQAISRLAGGIAHDFNNLLHGVRMCSNLLAEELAQDNDSRELLKHINSSIESAEQLAQWLLSYCRPRKVAHQRTNLNCLVISVSDLLRHTLGSSVSVQTELSEGLGAVHVDPVQMQEVLINLAINAQDAMPEGGSLSFVTQSVKWSLADRQMSIPPGCYVLLSVIDTGVGMNPDTASRAFQPFFTTKERKHGTGLGLSIVHDIVTQSAGFIRLETDVGKGTKFDIFFPACDDNDPHELENMADSAA